MMPRVYAGASILTNSCDVCRKPIVRGSNEYEIEFSTFTVRLDRACFELWLDEVFVSPSRAARAGPRCAHITRALAVEYPSIRRGGTCASCGRTVATILFQGAISKCAHCSRPLNDGAAGVVIDGDRFHDACLRRRITDETIRVSRALSRRVRS